ncbi:MAG TPA: single-stranded DNA-binding protein [Bacteroidales bacterium]|nr:single-stranded DNA-binding protein [Bacteroidales bacterium]
MNNLRNKVQLIGNLGQNPEIRTFDNGRSMAKFSLATSESYRDSSGKKILETQWHNIVAWGPIVKTIEKHFLKGTGIALEGKLIHRVWEDKEGKKRFITEVVLNDFMLLKPKEAETEE